LLSGGIATYGGGSPDSFSGETELISRRNLLNLVAASGVAPALLACSSAEGRENELASSIIDTNVSLFRWPFRRLPLDETGLLVAKLRSLGIRSAWAGSFEGLLHRDIRAVNDRLVSECRKYRALMPVGSINPTLPDWETDFERCVNLHKMHVIRLHPNYHGYKLDDARFVSLLKRADAADCAVQIAVSMEDVRTQNETMRVADVQLAPLLAVLDQAKQARVQLLNYRPRGEVFGELAKRSNVYFDTARVDGTDGIPRLVRAVGECRVLFGSHAPFLIPEAAMIRVHESGQLNAAALHRVYARNTVDFTLASK
jgi:predicted TIM-barrel fold metal-dependent hydrolase